MLTHDDDDDDDVIISQNMLGFVLKNFYCYCINVGF